MRTEAGRPRRALLAAALLAAAAAAPHGAWAAEEASGGAEATAGFGADWLSWHAANDVADMASVQRGAQLRQLLPRVPFAQVRALVAPGAGLGRSAAAAGAGSAAPRRQARAVHP